MRESPTTIIYAVVLAKIVALSPPAHSPGQHTSSPRSTLSQILALSSSSSVHVKKGAYDTNAPHVVSLLCGIIKVGSTVMPLLQKLHVLSVGTSQRKSPCPANSEAGYKAPHGPNISSCSPTKLEREVL